jgi:hypothetical protein
MTPRAPQPPASKPAADRHLARDVAKHLDRRRMGRKLFLWTILLGAIVLAALYLTCGRGWGLGGKGKGAGPGTGPAAVQTLVSPVDAGPRRCQIRIAASGITAGGKPATVDEAVAACKGATAAEVLVTGGARQGDWEDVKAALERAGIQILLFEPKSGSAGSADSPGSREPTGGR